MIKMKEMYISKWKITLWVVARYDFISLHQNVLIK